MMMIIQIQYRLETIFLIIFLFFELKFSSIFFHFLPFTNTISTGNDFSYNFFIFKLKFSSIFFHFQIQYRLETILLAIFLFLN